MVNRMKSIRKDSREVATVREVSWCPQIGGDGCVGKDCRTARWSHLSGECLHAWQFQSTCCGPIHNQWLGVVVTVIFWLRGGPPPPFRSIPRKSWRPSVYPWVGRLGFSLSHPVQWRRPSGWAKATKITAYVCLSSSCYGPRSVLSTISLHSLE